METSMKDRITTFLDNLWCRWLPTIFPWMWHADDHITVVAECPEGICDGSGEIQDWYYDSDSHNHIPDGTRPCLCRMREPEYEPEL